MIAVYVAVGIVVVGWVSLGRWHERVADEQAAQARRLVVRENAVARREVAVLRRERALERTMARVLRAKRQRDPASDLAGMVPAETAVPVWSEEAGS